MKIKLEATLEIDIEEILSDCYMLAPRDEITREIKQLVLFWGEQRLVEEGWPVPCSIKDIRDYLMENELISR
ncbi:hypothetical protein NV379_08020 [Paenibacillus sp. N1-5-1-14]|uniref:hypothetical protein n=1 Tax=Paenibacillus radicibacter TaxID=2972488 RepID=UPI002158E9F4|nr:hypothetical protein [Paenibacillus radicibacter]MCR8642608.1 hypothetical protein [Paenibacillus radicibacter]